MDISPYKGIWPPSRFSIGYGPWKPQFEIENQIFLLDLPKIITFCPKTVLFYILDVFRAHLKSPFWIQKVVSLPILAYFCFNFGLFSPRYALIFCMWCILSHKPILPKIVIFLLPGGVHCGVIAWSPKSGCLAGNLEHRERCPIISIISEWMLYKTLYWQEQ